MDKQRALFNSMALRFRQGYGFGSGDRRIADMDVVQYDRDTVD